MLPDEILRLDRDKCIVLFQGHKPALLYKLAPENIPAYAVLRSRRIIDYVPEWKETKAAIAEKPGQTMPSSVNGYQEAADDALTSKGKPGKQRYMDSIDYDYSNIGPDCGEEKTGYEVNMQEVLGMDESNEL